MNKENISIMLFKFRDLNWSSIWKITSSMCHVENVLVEGCSVSESV